jgi:RNA polymerase sigma factor for flagellar operon FliA
MLDELRNSDWLPRSIRQNMRKIEGAMNAMQQRLGRSPSETEIADELRVPLAEYQEMLSDGSGHQLIYYEDFHDSEGGENFLDRYCVDEAGDPLRCLLNGAFREAVVGAIDGLPEREKILMSLYYEQELNLKEIGAVMGVSESRVCQLHSQAIARLRTKLRDQAWTGLA